MKPQNTSRLHQAGGDEGGCTGCQGNETNSRGLHVHVRWCVRASVCVVTRGGRKRGGPTGQKGGRSDCENCVVVPRSASDACLEMMTSPRLGRVGPGEPPPTPRRNAAGPQGRGRRLAITCRAGSGTCSLGCLGKTVPGQRRRGKSSTHGGVTQRRLVAGSCIIAVHVFLVFFFSPLRRKLRAGNVEGKVGIPVRSVSSRFMKLVSVLEGKSPSFPELKQAGRFGVGLVSKSPDGSSADLRLHTDRVCKGAVNQHL